MFRQLGVRASDTAEFDIWQKYGSHREHQKKD
jgi:hypothetical protein